MNIKPLFNNIFVEAVKEEKTTKGGIFIPESAEENLVLVK